MKSFTKICFALVVNFVMGALIGTAAGFNPAICAVGSVGVGTALSFVPFAESALREGVFTEIWTGEVVKKLRSGLDGSWLDGIPDNTSMVKNDAIHLVEVGIDPDVLVDNTDYPIELQKLDDSDIVIKLNKFVTKRTPITDDELYAASYDKMARVKESHGKAINDAKFAKSAHNLCPKQNTKQTPVIKTTGKIDEATGRRRLTYDDLVSLKAALDKNLVPAENRRLVLCPDHVNDLLLTNQSFERQFNIDRNTGKIGTLAGFDIYTYSNTPIYTVEGVKKSFKAIPGEGEFNCSFAFYTPRVFKATGSTKMYYREASLNPDTQQSEINFRHYFIAIPKVNDASAAIMSGYEAAVNGEGDIPVKGED